MNHGCNGRHNYGSLVKEAKIYDDDDAVSKAYDPSLQSEATADSRIFHDDAVMFFNLVVDRHMEHDRCGYDGSLRDIAGDEEMFTNYLFMTAEKEAFGDTIRELIEQCSEKKAGIVVQKDNKQEN